MKEDLNDAKGSICIIEILNFNTYLDQKLKLTVFYLPKFPLLAIFKHFSFSIACKC